MFEASTIRGSSDLARLCFVASLTRFLAGLPSCLDSDLPDFSPLILLGPLLRLLPLPLVLPLPLSWPLPLLLPLSLPLSPSSPSLLRLLPLLLCSERARLLRRLDSLAFSLGVMGM